MNANSSETHLIFSDRPIFSEAAFTRPTTSTLREACREESDSLDTLLRCVLVLCMLVALTLGGWHVSTSQTNKTIAAQPTIAAKTCPVDARYVF